MTNTQTDPTIGIIGSGEIGSAIARAQARTGIEAVIANGREPESLTRQLLRRPRRIAALASGRRPDLPPGLDHANESVQLVETGQSSLRMHERYSRVAAAPKQGNDISNALPSASLDQLFRAARTHKDWSNRPVEEEQIRELYELLKWGPTSLNSCPARFVFVRSSEGKQKLADAAWEFNRAKILAAPLTVIIGNDLDFGDKLPTLLGHLPPERVATMLAAMSPDREVTATRNATLQGAYLILAARALGLDCGPMSGFDNDVLDQAFFPDGRIKSSFICSLGYGNPESLQPRSARLGFEDVAHFV
jgi:3-hydroxypropanoate dehydrogenase